MRMYKERVLKILLFNLFFMGLLPRPAFANDSPATVKHKMDFLPVTVFLGCSNETPRDNQVFLPRSDVADMSVNALECVDKTRVVSEIRPLGVGVIYEDNIDVWSVLIIVNKSDSVNIEKISRDGAGRKIVFDVEGRVVAAAVLNAPITDAKIEVSSDSRESAHRLSMAFIESRDRW